MHTTKNTGKTPSQRFSLTLRGLYVELIELMVEEGLYLDAQAVCRAGLRLLFEHHNSERYENILRHVREDNKLP
ncbi:hypothetical protein ES705_40303 [subsurface metagenome]